MVRTKIRSSSYSSSRSSPSAWAGTAASSAPSAIIAPQSRPFVDERSTWRSYHAWRWTAAPGWTSLLGRHGEDQRQLSEAAGELSVPRDREAGAGLHREES